MPFPKGSESRGTNQGTDVKHLRPYRNGGNNSQLTKLVRRAHITLGRSCCYLFLGSLTLYSLVQDTKHDKQTNSWLLEAKKYLVYFALPSFSLTKAH